MTERRNTIGDEVPNRIGQDENGDNWRRNEAEIREYAAIARDRAVQRAGQRVCHSFMNCSLCSS
ncbi:unnamed protein product [Orchesella dallaii]|uniref:Uncharacterized protein n=1 Tax=Orchesella dallaii TaxID=48710 RepID=A0ABP1S6R8_9HEXA